MKKAINVLKNEINDKLDLLEKFVVDLTQKEGCMYHEHVEDYKIEIQEYRRAIAVLTYFNMEDVLNEIMNKEK